MTIDYSKTLQAYQAYEGQMNHLTRIVHDYVLSDEYLGNKSKAKQVLRGMDKIINSTAIPKKQAMKELLVQSLIGKLRYKLPYMHLDFGPGFIHLYDRDRCTITAAALVTNVFLDSGKYGLREEIRRLDSEHGPTKFKKFYYVQFEGVQPEVDYYQGLHLEPGVVNQHSVSGWKLSHIERQVLEAISSVPFKIWQGCTTELLEHGYSLRKDWWAKADKNGDPLSEDGVAKRIRIKKYGDKIVNHVKRFPKFYFSAKYDDAKRAYYEAAVLDGMRPQGKLWETLMIDCAEPQVLTENDVSVLRHIIYVTIHGRASMEQACKKFSKKDLSYAKSVDPMKAETEDQFGEYILLNKAAQALDDAANGVASTSMFGLDFTNSGLMMAGVQFHSKEMMKAANLGGHKTVYDSHTAFAKGFGLEREQIKQAHTALLHGSTYGGLVEELKAVTGDESITEQAVIQGVEKAYGDCVRNITTIADWGTLVRGNRQSVVRWTMPDGVKAASVAKMLNVPVKVHAISARHKEGYCSYVVVSTMPLLEDKNGFPVFDKHTELDGVHYPVEVKKRGLFASLTHGCDSYVLRNVVLELAEAGRPFMLKHDDYIVPPGAHLEVVLPTAQRELDVLYERNVYQSALEEIAKHSPYHPPVPTLIVGDADNTVSQSVNFLMP